MNFFFKLFFQEVGLDQELKLKTGDKMRFSIDEQYRDNGNESVMFIDAALVFSQIKTGSTVIIEDGPLTFVIKEKGIKSENNLYISYVGRNSILFREIQSLFVFR